MNIITFNALIEKEHDGTAKLSKLEDASRPNISKPYLYLNKGYNAEMTSPKAKARVQIYTFADSNMTPPGDSFYAQVQIAPTKYGDIMLSTYRIKIKNGRVDDSVHPQGSYISIPMHMCPSMNGYTCSTKALLIVDNIEYQDMTNKTYFTMSAWVLRFTDKVCITNERPRRAKVTGGKSEGGRILWNYCKPALPISNKFPIDKNKPLKVRITIYESSLANMVNKPDEFPVYIIKDRSGIATISCEDPKVENGLYKPSKSDGYITASLIKSKDFPTNTPIRAIMKIEDTDQPIISTILLDMFISRGIDGEIIITEKDTETYGMPVPDMNLAKTLSPMMRFNKLRLRATATLTINPTDEDLLHNKEAYKIFLFKTPGGILRMSSEKLKNLTDLSITTKLSEWQSTHGESGYTSETTEYNDASHIIECLLKIKVHIPSTVKESLKCCKIDAERQIDYNTYYIQDLIRLCGVKIKNSKNNNSLKGRYIYIDEDGEYTTSYDTAPFYECQYRKIEIFDIFDLIEATWKPEPQPEISHSIIRQKNRRFRHFQKVVARRYNGTWECVFFSHQDTSGKYICSTKTFDECLPFNRHTAKLIGCSTNIETK